MPDKPIEQLKQALTDLSATLDDPKVKTAIGCIPDSIKTPVLEALKAILKVIKETLDEIRKELNCIADADPLLDVVSSLVEAAKGLVQSDKGKADLDTVKHAVDALKDIPSAGDIDAILLLIGQILTKLEAL